jgi:hypothetical protein
VWRPGLGLNYSLVGSTVPARLIANSLNANLPASIVVSVGDVLGLRLEGAASCALTTNAAGDSYGFFPRAASVPPTSPQLFIRGAAALLDVSVTLDTTTVTPSGCDSTGSSTGGDNCKQ